MTRRRRRKKEAPQKLMLINAREVHEVRVGVLAGNVLEEVYIERAATGRLTGNIYKGVVENADHSLQAAFVDIGTRRNAFLHAKDVIPPHGGFEEILGGRREKPAPGRRLSIRDMLRSRQEVLVQVTRDGIGTKGPAVTTYLSLPGRYLVLMPALGKVGVSKKIEDDELRHKLRARLDNLPIPANLGLIVRTAAFNASDAALKRDLAYLKRLWNAFKRKAKSAKAPAVVYEEQSLVVRALRERLTTDTDEVIVDAEDAFQQAKEFVEQVSPSMGDRVKLYEAREPLFTHHGAEVQVERLFDRTVMLPSGGYLVIEQTEAMVAVDVNTGKNRERSSSEDMILNTNLEAARELARQLRLRDIGGLVLVDFIDMARAESKRELTRTLREIFRKDRARVSIAPISSFGVVEITRQRTGGGLRNVVYSRCPYCAGTGSVRSGESLGILAMRALQEALYRDPPPATVNLVLHPSDVPDFSNAFRGSLAALETDTGVRIMVLPDASVNVGRIKVVAERDEKELFTLER